MRKDGDREHQHQTDQRGLSYFLNEEFQVDRKLFRVHFATQDACAKSGKLPDDQRRREFDQQDAPVCCVDDAGEGRELNEAVEESTGE